MKIKNVINSKCIRCGFPIRFTKAVVEWSNFYCKNVYYCMDCAKKKGLI